MSHPFSTQKRWQHDVPPQTLEVSPSGPSTVVTTQSVRSGHSSGMGVHSAAGPSPPVSRLDASQPPSTSKHNTTHRTQPF